jgi:signal transduction histidine kinase
MRIAFASRVAAWPSRPPRTGGGSGALVTSSGENSTISVPASYEAERRRLVLSRLRSLAMLALGPIALAVPLNLWVFTDTAGRRIALLGAVAVVCGSSLVLTRMRAVARWPDALAIGFVLAVATVTGRLLLESPEDLDVFVGVVAVSMVTTALFVPWRGRSQLVASLAMAAGYCWLLTWTELDIARTANVMIALFDGVFLSVVGAYALDAQRRATFDEREQAAELAEQRELLLDVGHELNQAVDGTDLAPRIVRRGRALVGGDSCSLVLVDTDRGTVRTAAVDGDLPSAYRVLREREALASAHHPFFQEMRRHACVEIPGGTTLDVIADDLRTNFGIQRVLIAPIRSDGDFLGYLSLTKLHSGEPFTAAQRRLAHGLAELSAVALANARLVDQLQRASRIKSEFVSTMSHELRTPLGVIMGYTEILEDGDPALWSDAIARIKHASAELLDMIQETLNLNRLESGRDVPILAPVELRPFWDELATELALLPRAPAVTLRFAPAADAVIATDRRKLRIVVKNLVGNALKFTATGEVAASVTLDELGCTLVVRDTGIGIAEKDLPVIFEMFRQADSSDRRAYGGVGLGLHIVQRLTAQLGGRIAVDSAPGRGSTFRVTLPPSVIVSARAAA